MWRFTPTSAPVPGCGFEMSLRRHPLVAACTRSLRALPYTDTPSPALTGLRLCLSRAKPVRRRTLQ